jgi:hypothetical protein
VFHLYSIQIARLSENDSFRCPMIGKFESKMASAIHSAMGM